jgi:hypothetical protein
MKPLQLIIAFFLGIFELYACLRRKSFLIHTINYGTSQRCHNLSWVRKSRSPIFNRDHVMKPGNIIAVIAPAVICLSPSALNAQIYSDLYMTDSGHWNVNASQLTPSTPFDYQANWGVSYTPNLGVPQDPYSISTTALQLKVNETSGEQAGVSVSPISLALSTNFVMTFDMWLNYNSGGFTSGSSQVGSYGIAPNSTTAMWAGIGNGQLFGELTDNGSTNDYRGYNNGVTIGSGPFVAGSQNETAAYYTNLFPSVAVPAGETALDANQFGNSFSGSVSFQWVKVNVSYYNGVLSESINGNLIASYTNAFVGSDIFLGMYDINNGSAGTNGLSDQNYVLFCNVQVEPIPPIAYSFRTIAGSTNSGSADGAGTNATFNGLQGTTVDINDNVYVADTGNSTIRSLTFGSTNWISATLAGAAGFLGTNDGSNAVARYFNPQGITVDTASNVYIADTGNSVIRKLTLVGTNWVTITIAGLAQNNGSTDGTNKNSRFFYPEGIAVDRFENLYVADTINDTIRLITPVGTNWITTTIAGSPGIPGTNDGSNASAHFFNPEGITVDGLRNVYVADTTNNTIREISPVGTNWIVRTIAGLAQFSGSADGPNQTSRFADPGGVTVDGAGNLFVSDSRNETIRKMIPAGTNWLVTTIGGKVGVAGYADGLGTNTLFDLPKGIAADWFGNIFIDGNSVSEGFAVFGGVTLVGLSFVSGNQYWIHVNLGSPAATNAGAAWGLQEDSVKSLSFGPNYTRLFTTPTDTLQFAYVDGWHEPPNVTIQVMPGFANEVVTNLFYTPTNPVLVFSNNQSLWITGTSNTTYNILYVTNLLTNVWQKLKTTSALKPGTSNFISSWPPSLPPPPPNPIVPEAFYRAQWTTN